LVKYIFRYFTPRTEARWNAEVAEVAETGEGLLCPHTSQQSAAVSQGHSPALRFPSLFSFTNEMPGNLICFVVNPFFLIQVFLGFVLSSWDS